MRNYWYFCSLVSLFMPLTSALSLDYQPGDANMDCRFDSTDLIKLMESGTYESNKPAFWSSGDFDKDVRFTSKDIAAAFQTGNYEAEEPYCTHTVTSLGNQVPQLILPEDMETFNRPISISNDFALLGGAKDFSRMHYTSYSGYTAWIYRLENGAWKRMQELPTSEGGFRHYHYGVSQDLSGNVAVVGNRAGTSSAGKSIGVAHVYRYDGTQWNEEAVLMPPPSAIQTGTSGWFGSAVAIDGNTIVVGDAQVKHENGLTGAAYIYEFNGAEWVNTKTISGSTSGFGASVSVSDTKVVVATGRYNEVNQEVYVFGKRENDWSQEFEGKLYESAGTGLNRKFDFDGNSIVALSSWGMNVFSFDGASWSPGQKIMDFNHFTGQQVSKIALDGNLMAVMLFAEREVYLYQFEDGRWLFQNMLRVAPVDDYSQIVTDVSLSNGQVAVTVQDVESKIKSVRVY